MTRDLSTGDYYLPWVDASEHASSVEVRQFIAPTRLRLVKVLVRTNDILIDGSTVKVDIYLADREYPGQGSNRFELTKTFDIADEHNAIEFDGPSFVEYDLAQPEPRDGFEIFEGESVSMALTGSASGMQDDATYDCRWNVTSVYENFAEVSNYQSIYIHNFKGVCSLGGEFLPWNNATEVTSSTGDEGYLKNPPNTMKLKGFFVRTELLHPHTPGTKVLYIQDFNKPNGSLSGTATQADYQVGNSWTTADPQTIYDADMTLVSGAQFSETRLRMFGTVGGVPASLGDSGTDWNISSLWEYDGADPYLLADDNPTIVSIRMWDEIPAMGQNSVKRIVASTTGRAFDHLAYQVMSRNRNSHIDVWDDINNPYIHLAPGVKSWNTIPLGGSTVYLNRQYRVSLMNASNVAVGTALEDFCEVDDYSSGNEMPAQSHGTTENVGLGTYYITFTLVNPYVREDFDYIMVTWGSGDWEERFPSSDFTAGTGGTLTVTSPQFGASAYNTMTFHLSVGEGNYPASQAGSSINITTSITDITTKYGLLYNWFAVDGNNGGGSGEEDLAPAGWHVATRADFDAIETFLGSTANTGSQMAGCWRLWNSGALLDADYFGETELWCLPAGKRTELGVYQDAETGPGVDGQDGDGAWFWTSEVSGLTQSYIKTIDHGDKTLSGGTRLFNNGMSVRMVKDSLPHVATVTDNDGNVYLTREIGGALWTQTNWKSTTYNDGTPINHYNATLDWTGATDGGYVEYDEAP